MEVKIVDEHRRPLPPGEVGELACRGDSIMLGYFGGSEADHNVVDEQGWYYTGDLALLDAKGYLKIVGRRKDVILRAGQTIHPSEIERHLLAHAKIREAAVVGVPSSLTGETIWAFVLLQTGEQMTAQEVKEHCRSRLEACKIPSRVRFVADLPRSETGKPQKFRLRELALAELESGKPQ
jgi:acyl-CoA synthetase (AMP-forming)/AMP-acid ligase II